LEVTEATGFEPVWLSPKVMLQHRLYIYKRYD